MVLGDRHQRHKLAGVDRGHLRAVVRPGDQDRTVLVVVAERQPVGGEQPLVLERPGEQQLHLGVGLLAREEVADPVAGDDINDRVSDPLAAGEVGRVPDPDPVVFPGNLGKRGLRGSWAEPFARQPHPVLQRHFSSVEGRRTPRRCSCRGARACDGRGPPDPTSRLDRGSPAPPRPAARGPRRRPDGGPPACPFPAAADASDARDCQPDQAPGTPERAPTRPDRTVDQPQQLEVGLRAHARGDRAEKPERCLPRYKVNSTAISFSASDSRSFSDGRPPARRPRARPPVPASPTRTPPAPRPSPTPASG